MDEDLPSSEQYAETSKLEMATSDPLGAHNVPSSDQEAQENVKDNLSHLSQEQMATTDRATGESVVELESQDSIGTAREVKGKGTDLSNSAASSHQASSSVEESRAPRDEETLHPSAVSSQKAVDGKPQYQLVFGMDDTGSEASFNDSPDVRNPVLGYQLSHQHYLPSPIASQSHDLGVKSGDLESLSHDLISESHHQREAEETDDSVATDRKVSTTSTTGDEVSSIHSSSTLKAGSVSGESAIKPSSTEKEREETATPDSEVKLEDIKLQSVSPESPRDTPPIEPKVHALNVLTSDSDAGESPPYSPVPYLSGDEDNSHPTPTPITLPTSPISPTVNDQPSMSILFGGVFYLGSSSVDAPVSEREANRKMYILKKQAEESQPIPVVLSIPLVNEGSILMKDPESEQPMSVFPVKTVLFCARGNADELLNCFCLNIRHKRSGIYHCHVFQCEIREACQKVFDAIGKAFKTKPANQPLPPLTTNEMTCDFDVSVEIYEDDGKGGYSSVPLDKDCFKLRQNTKKKIALTVSQPSTARPLNIERCFGLLISPGKDVKNSEMNLLDNMNTTSNERSYTVAGIWETGVSFLAALNEETPKSTRYQVMTVAADLIVEAITEPVRFLREVKVHVSKPGGVGRFMSNLTRKKNNTTTETFRLSLKRTLSGGGGTAENAKTQSMYTVVELKSIEDLKREQQVARFASGAPSPATDAASGEEVAHPSPLSKLKRHSLRDSSSSTPPTKPAAKVKEQDEQDESDDDNDVVVSGWGEVDDMREDLLKDWGELLEKWDGREKTRPSKLINLCRKGIPRHLRCQVWQMLTGASYDPQLHEAYRLLIIKESPAENVINWDIKRTYVGHGFFQEEDKKEALYKISKAYSVYDEEVGYCQGFSFMAAVVLLQKMPEEEAFAVLVKIMYNYGHRDVFKANFQNLHLMFYQLDRLLEEYLPDLYQHFQANRIETHMYASQWFLTIYTAKFPLSIVFRILDIYLCEGVQVLFQIALALLKTAKKDLLTLDFEGILNYFRVSLPKRFQTEQQCQHLFHALRGFKVNEKKLSKLDLAYQSYLEQQAQLEDPVRRLERENKQLRDTIIRLEQENDNLAQELVASKVTLRTEMDKLEERIDTLSKEARAQKSSAEASQILISELREELVQAKQEYQKVMIQLMEERQQHEAALAEYKQVFHQLDEGHKKEQEELSQELLEVKAKLGSSSDDDDIANHSSQLSSEQRLRNLELELAQTKLALVESQCKNQELEHKVKEATSGQRAKNWPFSIDFGNKKK